MEMIGLLSGLFVGFAFFFGGDIYDHFRWGVSEPRDFGADD
jgi:hypothetical protein